MAELFIRFFLGHLIGDYLIQTSYMALNKKAAGWRGHIACVCHCLTYTIAVCLMLWTFNWLVWVLVFISHFIIDRSKFVAWWMDKVKGLTFEKENSSGPFAVSIFSFLLIVVDNSFHFLFMWLIIKFLMV